MTFLDLFVFFKFTIRFSYNNILIYCLTFSLKVVNFQQLLKIYIFKKAGVRL